MNESPTCSGRPRITARGVTPPRRRPRYACVGAPCERRPDHRAPRGGARALATGGDSFTSSEARGRLRAGRPAARAFTQAERGRVPPPNPAILFPPGGRRGRPAVPAEIPRLRFAPLGMTKRGWSPPNADPPTSFPEAEDARFNDRGGSSRAAVVSRRRSLPPRKPSVPAEIPRPRFAPLGMTKSGWSPTNADPPTSSPEAEDARRNRQGGSARSCVVSRRRSSPPRKPPATHAWAPASASTTEGAARGPRWFLAGAVCRRESHPARERGC